MSRPSSLLPFLAFILCVTFASACTNSSPQETSNIGRRESPIAYKPSTTQTSPPTISATPYDPINDDSEEGVRQNILAAAESKITYEHLKKNADRYNGEPWAFNGRVFQIQESGGQTAALLSLDAWGNKMMEVQANFTTDFVEKDQVYVVGYLAGNYSYTSVAGWNITIPLIEARAILKPSEAVRIKGGKGVSKR